MQPCCRAQRTVNRGVGASFRAHVLAATKHKGHQTGVLAISRRHRGDDFIFLWESMCPSLRRPSDHGGLSTLVRTTGIAQKGAEDGSLDGSFTPLCADAAGPRMT